MTLEQHIWEIIVLSTAKTPSLIQHWYWITDSYYKWIPLNCFNGAHFKDGRHVKIFNITVKQQKISLFFI
jgi:hypothetical protein